MTAPAQAAALLSQKHRRSGGAKAAQGRCKGKLLAVRIFVVTRAYQSQNGTRSQQKLSYIFHACATLSRCSRLRLLNAPSNCTRAAKQDRVFSRQVRRSARARSPRGVVPCCGLRAVSLF